MGKFFVFITTILAFFSNANAQFALVTSNPQNNANSIPINQTITLEFTQTIDPLTVSGSLLVYSNLRGKIQGLIASQNTSLTFQPAGQLLYYEYITVTILSTLKSNLGNSISLPTTFRFSTMVKVSTAIPPVFIDMEIYREPNNSLGSIIAVDMDHDGDVDLLYGGNGGSGWLENTGNTNYLPHQIPMISGSFQEIKGIDIDLDGDMDILTARSYWGISLYVNDGMQNFSFVPLTGNIDSHSFDVADFDSNGLIDIVYSVYTQDISKTSILYNQGGNAFSSVDISNTIGVENKVIDIDRDGDWDVVQQSGSQIGYLLNNGASFELNIVATGIIYDMAVADFDDDNDIDIASAETGSLNLYVNTGGLNFMPKLIESDKYYRVIEAGDFDGDRDVDIMVPDYKHFNLLINDGVLNFSAVEVQNSHSSEGFSFEPNKVGTADLDNDGDLDFFSTINYFQVKTYKNVSLWEAYPFSKVNENIKAFSDGDADWGDFDNDGDLDLVMNGLYSAVPSTALYENQNGEFIEKPISMSGLYRGSCDWGDYDNDGDLDLLLAGLPNTGYENLKAITQIYTNDNGVFTSLQSSGDILPGIHNGEARWADIDNDGLLDIVFNGLEFSGIFRGDGKGGFLNKLSLPYAYFNSNVGFGDYDKDGDLDLAFSAWGGNEVGALLKVLRNDGFFNFSEATGDFIGRIGGNLNWFDMDNDGDLDLLVSGSKYFPGVLIPSITVYENQGNAFKALDNSEPLYYADSEGTSSIGDFNNDGISDVIASWHGGGNSPELTLLENDGDGDLKVVDIELPNLASRTANWGDFDKDHDLDFFVQTELLRNNSELKNTPPAPPSFIQFDSVYNNSIYMHWDAGNDLETPSAGLSYQIYMGTQSQFQDIVNSNAILGTGFRKISELGISKGNKTRVENLRGGDYFFSVQSIDASFEGSTFSAEIQTSVVRIQGNSGACLGMTYSYATEPPGNYNWQVNGGTIISGQGTASIEVSWNKIGRGYVKISNAQNVRNTLPVNVDQKPQPSIIGESSVCTGLQKYTIADVNTFFTTWNVSGENFVHDETSHSVTIDWKSSGKYELVAQSFPEHRGCSTYNVLPVSVDVRPTPTIFGQENTCTDQLEEYSGGSVSSTWKVTNGTLKSTTAQSINVKWPSSAGLGAVILKENSTNSYCSTLDTLSIKINFRPFKPILTLRNDTIFASRSPSNIYQWYYNDVAFYYGIFSGLIPKVSGNFSVEVFNEEGCGTKSDPIDFKLGGLTLAVKENFFRIYPNPGDQKIILQWEEPIIGEVILSIYSSSNSLVKEIQFQKIEQLLNKEIDISDFSPGLYVLIFRTTNRVYSSKFLKR